MLAIYKKELRTYFTSMIGYVFLAIFLLIIGIYFFVQNLFYRYANFEYTLSSIAFIFVLLVPLLTMRLMAEENKQKTDQLLLTSPLTATSIAMGKLFAVATIFLLAMAVTCFYPLILSLYGTVSFVSAYAGIFGFTLLGLSYLSLGLFISSLTESQVVAAVISYIVFLLTLLMEGIAGVLPTDNKSSLVIFTFIVLLLCLIMYSLMRNMTLAVGLGVIAEVGLLAVYLIKPTLFDGLVLNTFQWFSMIKRYDPFNYGIFDISSIIYYISVTFLFAFLTTQVIKKKRWS